MAREVITDTIWTELEKTLRDHGCHRWKNDRNIMEAILWKLRTGAPWRDIPRELCSWKTAYSRFNRWAEKGLWGKFFLSYEATLIRSGYSQMEATSALTSMQVELGVVKNERLGDRMANSPALIDKLEKAGYWIADKGYNSEDIRDYVRKKGMVPMIPRRSNSDKPNPGFDKYVYKIRHLVENLFARLKHFRSIATRFEKLARNFKSMVFIACTFIWLKLK